MKKETQEEQLLGHLAAKLSRKFPNAYGMIPYGIEEVCEYVTSKNIEKHFTYRTLYHDIKDQNRIVLDVYYSSAEFFHSKHRKNHEKTNRIVLKQIHPNNAEASLFYQSAVYLRNLFFQEDIDVDIFIE